MWHSQSLGQASLDEINGDRDKRCNPDRLKEAKANLPTCRPILWPQCAAELEATFDAYYDELVAREAQPAIEVVLAHIHHELETRLGTHLDRETRLELVPAQKFALDVLVGLLGNKGAKERLIAISNGRPMRVCTGSAVPRYVDVTPRNFIHTDDDGAKWRVAFRRRLQPMVTYAQGCFEVFEDESGTQSKMWPTWCKTHTKRLNPSVNPARDADHAIRATMTTYWHERVAAHVRSYRSPLT